jgi:hypothetical protein
MAMNMPPPQQQPNSNMQQRQNMPSADDQNDPLFMLKEM